MLMRRKDYTEKCKQSKESTKITLRLSCSIVIRYSDDSLISTSTNNQAGFHLSGSTRKGLKARKLELVLNKVKLEFIGLGNLAWN